MKDLEEKLIRAIDEDIRSHADLVEEVLNREKDILLNDQINFYREGIEKDKEAYLEGELKDLRTYAATKSSRDRLDVKKKLIELRTHYTDDLFNEVKKQVRDFSHSPAYDTYLNDALKNLDITETGIFEVREEDSAKMKKLLASMGCRNEIRTVFMPLGGFRFVDEANRTEYSCSLDEKCDEEFAWFTAHSSFTIMERGEM